MYNEYDIDPSQEDQSLDEYREDAIDCNLHVKEILESFDIEEINKSIHEFLNFYDYKIIDPKKTLFHSSLVTLNRKIKELEELRDFLQQS